MHTALAGSTGIIVIHNYSSPVILLPVHYLNFLSFDFSLRWFKSSHSPVGTDLCLGCLYSVQHQKPNIYTPLYLKLYNLVLFWYFVPFLVLDEVLVVSTMTPESVTWAPCLQRKLHFHLRREDKAVRSWWVRQMISKVYFGDCAVSLCTIHARQYSLNHKVIARNTKTLTHRVTKMSVGTSRPNLVPLA